MLFYATKENFENVTNLSALTKKAIRGVAETIREIDSSSQHFIILSDDTTEYPADAGDHVSELSATFDRVLHSSVLMNSTASDESGVGAPLPLDKIANLSAAESGEAVLVFPANERLSVLSFYKLGVEQAIPERQARLLLSNLLLAVKSGESSWLRKEGITVLIPCEKRENFPTVCTGLSFGSTLAALNVKCVKEDLYISQLPQLDSLRARLCIGRNQIINQEFESVYSLHAVKLPNWHEAVALVKYRASWQIARLLLDPPTIGAFGSLTVRPLVGWRSSDMHFLFKGIQRLKLLVAAIEAESCNWMPEYEDFDIEEFLADILNKFCQIATTSGCFGDKQLDQASILEKSTNNRSEAPPGPINEAMLAEMCDKEFDGRWKAAVKLRNRDVTEVLWLLLKVIDSRAHLSKCLQSIIKFLSEKNVPYRVEKNNFSELASVLRRLSFDGSRFLAPPLNRLSLLAEVGLFSLLNDHRAVLEAICRESCPNLAVLDKALPYYMETGTTLEEKMQRLERLHTACEFASLMSIYAGHQNIADSVQQVLTALSNEDPVPQEMVFKLPSGELLPILTKQRPTLWSAEFTVGERRKSVVKHLFQRPVRDVVGIADLTLARFTHLELLWQDVE